ncbi:amidohydrolase family protein [Hyphobacterium sp.]|uniref:amidohydrolase family protein n=1 Tax=Hyphobacterium sp. TaxID=2004662 RepID=UPI003BABD11B
MRLWQKAGVASVLVLALAACSPQQADEDSTATDTAVMEETAGTDTETMAAVEEAEVFTVLVGGTAIGAMEVATSDDGYTIEFEFRNNGRGPTLSETVTLNANGLPIGWSVEGNTTFGNAVAESFEFADSQASWTDATGTGEAVVEDGAFYVPQNASPYWLAIAARALMDDADGVLQAVPGGELRMSEIDRLEVSNGSETLDAIVFAMSGTSTNPTYFLMTGEAFFGIITPGFALLAEGFEGEDERLRGLAAQYGANRFAEIQSRVIRDYDAPVLIRNVHIFDPETETRGETASVLVDGNRISEIGASDMARPDNAVEIDGAGGTLLPGLFEMHGHMGETAAFLNIAAGVTSLRDTGNNNEVLGALVERIENGELAGPRIHRSGFIEGRSPFNSNNGIIVETEEEAVAAVHTYADAGVFHQIKIYNSINPAWVPAMIAAARERGLRVSGHVPAFTNADAMIEAGYDEMTHINQIMLGWVLEEGEDTRTLLRLTALRRLPALDLQSEAVQSTISEMAERGIALDPTFAIHEALLLSRNGEISPGTVDYVDHLPVDAQRQARSAWADIATPEDDANYRGAFDQITETLRMMREAGIQLVPGTDLGGSFTFHRELELYQTIGMTPPEILSWASHGMAEYLGVGDEVGLIREGYLADFFLVPGDPTQDLRDIKTIAMVMADGRVYFPTEIYPEFGIRPFTEVPNVIEPLQ